MRKGLGADWRTTVAGLGVVLAGVCLLLHSSNPDIQTAGGGLIAAGLGLMRAKDA